MTSLSKTNLGFSLIELMVVMAIMAVLMSLSGGLFQQSINQQERHVELEKIHQLFKQTAYKSYYQGKTHHIRLEENRLLFLEQAQPTSQEFDAEQDTSLLEQFLEQSAEGELPNTAELFVERSIEFSQLTFVAQDYIISSKGIINPREFGVFGKSDIRKYPLSSVFVANE
jgi:prepilin-type N-terminal cleavage/methylation domain-containing protein